MKVLPRRAKNRFPSCGGTPGVRHVGKGRQTALPVQFGLKDRARVLRLHLALRSGYSSSPRCLAWGKASKRIFELS